MFNIYILSVYTDTTTTIQVIQLMFINNWGFNNQENKTQNDLCPYMTLTVYCIHKNELTLIINNMMNNRWYNIAKPLNSLLS